MIFGDIGVKMTDICKSIVKKVEHYLFIRSLRRIFALANGSVA